MAQCVVLNDMGNITLANKTILVTGAAGFIGFHLSKLLMDTYSDVKIIGVDNMNDYYGVTLKKYRLAELEKYSAFSFIQASIADKQAMNHAFEDHKPQIVVHLAAQAGVRYSITNPEAYIESNVVGFFNILEACRHNPVEHLIYASSSSVYGSNKKVPYSVDDKVDNPVSLYAATKKSNELFAHAYCKLFKIPATGLRFFTVYGPAGRPDMAYYSFTDKMVRGDTIELFNHGDMYRDFTYIDDITTAMIKIIQKTPNENDEGVKHKVYNIGNDNPESLLDFVATLEKCLIDKGIISKPAKRKLSPMAPGDVYQTHADISELNKDFGFKPSTKLADGLAKFADWYKSYYIF